MKKILLFTLAIINVSFLSAQVCPSSNEFNNGTTRLFFNFASEDEANFYKDNQGTNTGEPNDCSAGMTCDQLVSATLVGMATPSNTSLNVTWNKQRDAAGPVIKFNDAPPTGVTAVDVFEGTITFNLIGGSTQVCVYDAAGLLPIELSYFRAVSTEKTVMLKWQTTAEINNAFMTVERSTNGKDFTAIETIDGAGDSHEIINYELEDRSPATGMNYYRLLQVDYDGTETFSEIVTIKFNDNRLDLNLYPTIVQEEVNLDLTSFENESVGIDILDATGRVLLNKVANSSEIFTLNIGNLNLNEGMYYVRCQSASQTTTGKFLVVK